MTNQTIPSQDPADSGSMPGSFKTILKKLSMNLEAQLPAIVVSYNRTTNIATVRPLIGKVATSGIVIPRAQIAAVPVLAMGCGKFVITYPLKPGDLGWIHANDRDISLFMQGKTDTVPNTKRLHSFSDSLFIPDAFDDYTFDEGDDSESMVIQSSDGTVKITLDPAKIRVIAPDIEATATGSITATAPTVSINAGAGATSFVCDAAGIRGSGPAISFTTTAPGAPGPAFDGGPVSVPDIVIGGVFNALGHVHTNPEGGNVGPAKNP